MQTLAQARVTLVLLAAAAVVQGCGGIFGGCVLRGTPVATPLGPVAVEMIREGDPVWTVRDDGSLEAGWVVAIRGAGAPSHLQLSLADGRSLGVTRDHPVGAADGFMPAGRLRPGDSLRTESGERTVIAVERVGRPSRVYDISVEPNNTYLAAGVVVHNKTVAPPMTREGLNGVWIGFDEGRAWRLVILPDGEGWLAIANRNEAVVYRIVELQYDRARKRPLFLRLRPLDEREPERILAGRAYGSRGREPAAGTLWFDLTGPLTLNTRRVSLRTEARFFEQMRDVEAATAAAAAEAVAR